MQLIVVSIKVKSADVEAFVAASLENAAASRRESGIFRFELLRDAADPARFLLVEGYRDADAPARHKASAHYLKWKDLVEPMMAEPRARTSYEILTPL